MVVICELRKNHILGVYLGYTQFILTTQGMLGLFQRYTQGIPRVYPGCTQGVLRVYSGYIQAILRVYLGYTWGILVVILGVYQLAKSQRYIWVLLEYTQGILGYTQDIIEVYLGYTLGYFPEYAQRFTQGCTPGYTWGILKGYSGYTRALLQYTGGILGVYLGCINWFKSYPFCTSFLCLSSISALNLLNITNFRIRVPLILF